MATRYLIIEDELAAFHLLSNQLHELCPTAEVVGPLQTIDEAVEYFETQAKPDLAFVDIHLADGSSFTIFDNVEVKCPIVFTTAYEQYALQAFDVNCIDYLLKPIDREKLEHALGKQNLVTSEKISGVRETIQEFRPSTRYNSCLLIHHRERLIPMPTSKIAIIYLTEEGIRLKTFDGEIYGLSGNLDDIYSKLNPTQFYRANRQQIISKASVLDITSWFGQKISVNLTLPTTEKVIVGKTKATEFKNWLIQ